MSNDLTSPRVHKQPSPISGAFFYFLPLQIKHASLHTSTNRIDFISEMLDSSSSSIYSHPAASSSCRAEFPTNYLRLTLAVTALVISFSQFNNNNMTC